LDWEVRQADGGRAERETEVGRWGAWIIGRGGTKKDSLKNRGEIASGEIKV